MTDFSGPVRLQEPPSRKKRQDLRTKALSLQFWDEAQLEAARVHFTHRFEGTYFVSAGANFEDPDERDGLLTLEIGQTRLLLPFDAGEQLLHALLCELYGEAQATALLALMQRLPEADADSGAGEGSRAAIRLLWEAAFRFRHLWPQRNAGFDDRLWGVAPPPGVTELFLADQPYRASRQPDPAFAAYLDPEQDPEFTDQPGGGKRWKKS